MEMGRSECFEVKTSCEILRGSYGRLFPWKTIWTNKVPKRIDFFVWTAAWWRIIMIDNMMKWNITLVNWCCLYKSSGDSVGHLLLQCSYATELLSSIFARFGVCWVMPRKVIDALHCWKGLFGKRGRCWVWDTSTTVHFLLWLLWNGRNNHSFNGIECLVILTKESSIQSLFKWSRVFGIDAASSIILFVDFLSNAL